MEPISAFITSALGYVLKGAAQSKTAGKAKEELLGRFWQWIKPRIIKDNPQIESKPEAAETEVKTEEKLVELIKDEEFFNELVKRVDELQKAGIREKNIVKGSIKGVKKIKIGDRSFSADEMFDRKNIVEGYVEDAEEFVLGDGH